jgi:hypothetical protein
MTDESLEKRLAAAEARIRILEAELGRRRALVRQVGPACWVIADDSEWAERLNGSSIMLPPRGSP